MDPQEVNFAGNHKVRVYLDWHGVVDFGLSEKYWWEPPNDVKSTLNALGAHLDRRLAIGVLTYSGWNWRVDKTDKAAAPFLRFLQESPYIESLGLQHTREHTGHGGKAGYLASFGAHIFLDDGRDCIYIQRPAPRTARPWYSWLDPVREAITQTPINILLRRHTSTPPRLSGNIHYQGKLPDPQPVQDYVVTAEEFDLTGEVDHIEA